MEELHKEFTSGNTPNTTPSHPRYFRKSIGVLSAMVLLGILLQHLSDTMLANGIISTTGITGGIAILALAAAVLLVKPVSRLIDSPPFAISSLLGLALGTAAGTFVTQHASPEVLAERYGSSASFLQWAHLDNAFHSWWYVGFFLLLTLSLTKISLKKKWSLENLGFYLSHLGPIVILAGFWADYFLGYRGIIKLEEGNDSKVVQLYAGSNQPADSVELAFRIRLDNFEFEKHDPDYRIQIWKRDTVGHPVAISNEMGMENRNQPEIIASLAPEPMKIRHIYGTDIYFRIREMFPNFTFKYVYPELTEGMEAKDPGIQMEVKTTEGDGTLQLLVNNPRRSKIMDESLFGGWVECYWDIPEEVQEKISQPAKAGEINRIILACKDRKVYFLFNGEVMEEALEENRFYQVPGMDDIGFEPLYIFPDASLMQAVPATIDENMENPVAWVEIWRAGQQGKDAYIYPGSEVRKSGTFNIPGSPFMLAFESFKDRETKYYKSDLSVLDDNGQVLKQEEIRVNEPMFYGGHRFYQTDYDPKNPVYSGIGVTYNPGLTLIYAGFYLLVAGIAWMFYFKKFKTATT